MSTPRTVRVTVDGITTNLRTISGCHYAVGDPALTSVLRVPRLPDGSAWCTVDVHSRPGADVQIQLGDGPGPKPRPPAARRSVELHIRLTPAEAERLGLAGADRHERARARLLGWRPGQGATPPAKYDWPRVVLLVRERRSETQAEFADALGCSVSTVSKWERGETVPAPKQRRRMEAMGVEAGLPSAEWPHETRQTNLFDEGQR